MKKFLSTALGFLFCFAALGNEGTAVLKKAVFGSDGKVTGWQSVDNADIRGKTAYVISHGLNDSHDAEWVNNIAASYRQQSNGQAVILSVDWDKDSSGPLASTRINRNVETLSQQLSGVNIETAVGHSYGSHLLAGVIGEGTATVKNFVALDPAEEALTWTGTSRDWSKAVEKTNVEVYKSSVFLGAEVTLGDYNYLLAKPGEISPLSLGGDWGGINPLAGPDSNHSLATAWYGQIIAATGQSSGWYTPKPGDDAAVGPGTWTGVVNTGKYQKLDYMLPAGKATGEWGEVFVEMGLDTDNWEGTVLKPSHKKRFDSQFEVQVTQIGGDEWKYDPKTGQYYKNGVLYTGGLELGQYWETSGSGNINSITDYLDSVMADAEAAGKDVLNDALETFIETWNSTTGSIWEKLEQSVKDSAQTAVNSIKANIKILIRKYASLDELKKVADLGLKKLLRLNPKLNEVFTNLGLDNINNIVGVCKDLFKLVRGLLNGGSFLDLLRNSDFLKRVFENAAAWGVGLLKNLLSNLASKLLSPVVKWLQNFIDKALSALGIKGCVNLQALLQKGVDSALNAGGKWIQAKIDDFLNPQTSVSPSSQTTNTGILQTSP
ncbi:MAG: hypothetical protein IJS01_10340 [Lentisphaeria bacterium]|nr:hypothetical protein [Lentisphaeria bacterium]